MKQYAKVRPITPVKQKKQFKKVDNPTNDLYLRLKKEGKLPKDVKTYKDYIKQGFHKIV